VTEKFGKRCFEGLIPPSASVQHTAQITPFVQRVSRFSMHILCNSAGQLQPTGGPQNSLKIRLMAAFFYTHISRVGGGFNSL